MPPHLYSYEMEKNGKKMCSLSQKIFLA